MNDGPRTVLGFDFGRKRIGVAVGQTLTGTASPLDTLRADQGRPDWPAIDRLLDTWRPDALVVGSPCNMDGTAHALTHAAGRFARQLRGRYGLAVHLVDERLSSLAAAERLNKTGRRRPRKGAKEQLDQVAAQIIVETWLGQRSGAAVPPATVP
ncbi:MAG TPA: Holliday junction resolvase RuvX [Gammaproteobacteria bacterium]|nr:Holliday junction resolvase RuvX [Gammaproteobacteria bacterium]